MVEQLEIEVGEDRYVVVARSPHGRVRETGHRLADAMHVLQPEREPEERVDQCRVVARHQRIVRAAALVDPAGGCDARTGHGRSRRPARRCRPTRSRRWVPRSVDLRRAEQIADDLPVARRYSAGCIVGGPRGGDLGGRPRRPRSWRPAAARAVGARHGGRQAAGRLPRRRRRRTAARPGSRPDGAIGPAMGASGFLRQLNRTLAPGLGWRVYEIALSVGLPAGGHQGGRRMGGRDRGFGARGRGRGAGDHAGRRAGRSLCCRARSTTSSPTCGGRASAGRLVALQVGELDALAGGIAVRRRRRCLLVPAADLPAGLWERLRDREPGLPGGPPRR